MNTLTKSEVINTGISSIESRSMQQLSNLVDVIFPSQLDKIGMQTFLNAVKLITITLPTINNWIDHQ